MLAGSGCYRDFSGTVGGRRARDRLAELVTRRVRRALPRIPAGAIVLYMGTASGRELVVLMDADGELIDTDKALVEVFCSRLSVAFDNVILYEQLERRQRAAGGARGAPHRAAHRRQGAA